MNDFNLIVSSLLLAALLPVSVAALYSLMASHTQLSPTAAMDSAVADRFDSEAERREFHAAHQARQQLRSAAVLAQYRQAMERELVDWDPRDAKPFRQALAAAAIHAAPTEALGPDHDDATDAAPLPQGAQPATPHEPPRQRARIALWRAHQAAQRQ